MVSFRPLSWPVDALASPAKARMQGIPDEVRRTRFPFRLLRYWFAHELLADEAKRRPGAPMRVAEVGIDAGQMLAYAREAHAGRGETPPWRHWQGVDCSPPTEALYALGYDALTQLDLEDRAAMAAQPSEAYDAVILLHVIEHLHEPEEALAEIGRWLKPGGVIIAGTPGTPEIARAWWQRRLRRRARPRGHVSVVSSTLVRRWGDRLGLQTEQLNGAFFMRKKGFSLENQAWWLRANLAFGAVFPSWPGELYWTWRKPSASSTAGKGSAASTGA